MAENPTSTVTIVLPANSGRSDYLIVGSYDALIPCAHILNHHGMIAAMESEGSAFRLRVAGVRNAAQLANVLTRNNISVQQATDKTEAPPSAKDGFGKWLKDHTLKVAGITYLFGDFSLFFSGLLAKRYKESAAGLIYASGGAISAVYGDPSANRQIKNVGKALSSFLARMGATVNPDTALYHLRERNGRGPLTFLTDFLYEHPSEVHNAIYAYGGTSLLQSGLGKRSASDPAKRSGWLEDTASGALVTAGGAIGAFVKEDEKEDNAKSKGIMDWIKRKPLRLSGYLYTLNNFFLIRSAWLERKSDPSQKGYRFKFFTAASFLVANTFLSLSSRHNDSSKETTETKNDMISALAAEVIATQPDGSRDLLIRQVAGFLSERHETRQDMQKWDTIIRAKVEGLRSNRQVTDKNVAVEMPELENNQKAKIGARENSWQEKVNSVPGTPVTSQIL